MVSKDGSIELNKIVKGQDYRVVLTKRGSSDNVWSARDTILNQTTGQKKELTRKEWYKLFSKFE